MNILNEDLKLKYLIRKPETESSEKPVFIFLHGFGSNERDLFSLSSLLPDNFTVISARSPYTLAHGSYSFYNIDYSSGTKIINTDQADKSRILVKEFIDQIISKYEIDPRQVYLGGFSQGAIMSFSVALSFPGTISALSAFSCYILDDIKELIKPDEKLESLKVFMSHGVYDEVIPVKQCRAAKDFLNSLGIKPEYHEFNGGHEIPEIILKNFHGWINLNFS